MSDHPQASLSPIIRVSGNQLDSDSAPSLRGRSEPTSLSAVSIDSFTETCLYTHQSVPKSGSLREEHAPIASPVTGDHEPWMAPIKFLKGLSLEDERERVS